MDDIDSYGIKFVKANVGEIMMDRQKSASFAKFMKVYNEQKDI